MVLVEGVRSSLTSLALIVVACFSATDVFHLASAAGRAFPVESENYIIREFQRINHRLIWDKSNFLTDLSGHYSDCSRLFDRGPIVVKKETPEGESVVGYVDYTRGSLTDVNSVKDYLTVMIDRWTRNGGREGVLHDYILGANRFGCSIRPGCSDHVVATCLFSPGQLTTGTEGYSGTPEEIIDLSSITTERTTPTTEGNGFPFPPALAFTPEQYEMAEGIAGMTWDRSHFLENLSGWETSCSMIGHCPGWKFTRAKGYGDKRRLDIRGGCGFSPNEGSTPEALKTILGTVKHFSDARRIGCSLIADCRFPYHGPEYGRMYVVVSCLYLSQSSANYVDDE